MQINKTNTTNRPIKKFQAGAVSATIWENQDKSDPQVFYRTVSFDRTYKDKGGSWKTTNSLRTADLPKAQIVLKKAYEFLILKEDGEQYSAHAENPRDAKGYAPMMASQIN